jgi:hypothetical protein
MTIDDVLSYYKTTYNFNKQTKISSGNFVDWRRKGYIPISMQHRIQVLTDNKLKVGEPYMAKHLL